MKIDTGSKIVVLLLLILQSDGFKPRTVIFLTRIESGSEECYGEDVEKNIKEIQVDVRLRKDVSYEIGLVVTAEGSELYRTEPGDGVFREWIHEDPSFPFFEFCLKNHGRDAKVVEVMIWHMTPDDLEEEGALSKLSDAEYMNLQKLPVPIYRFNKRIDAIREKLKEARAAQTYFRENEQRDLELMLKNQDDVFFWGAFVISYLIVMAMGRSFIIRTLFEEKSRIGNLLRKGKTD